MKALSQALVRAGQALHGLGLSPGSSGNLSVRTERGFLITPTGKGLHELTAEEVSHLRADGTWLTGPAPTKEVPLHLALYERDPAAAAVVHLHSTHAVAVSCLDHPEDDGTGCLPPLTAYFVMRVGPTPLIPYAAPGDDALAGLVRAVPYPFRAALLANHGPVVTGTSLQQAVDAAIELEEAARLHLLLRGHRTRPLGGEQLADLAARHRTHWPDPRPDEGARTA